MVIWIIIISAPITSPVWIISAPPWRIYYAVMRIVPGIKRIPIRPAIPRVVNSDCENTSGVIPVEVFFVGGHIVVIIIIYRGAVSGSVGFIRRRSLVGIVPIV
jgi:hypothetical protein